MKISGTISFILKLLLGLALVVFAMGMEVVLKLSGVLIAFGAVVVLMAIPEFILALKNKGRAFGIVNIITMLICIVFFFISSSAANSDYLNHTALFNKNDSSYKLFFITLVIEFILGITNTIIGFTSKSK